MPSKELLYLIQVPPRPSVWEATPSLPILPVPINVPKSKLGEVTYPMSQKQIQA